MKKTIIICLMVISFSLGTKSAYSLLNIEVFGSFATKPMGAAIDISSSFGGGLGLSFDIVRVSSAIMLQLRFDVTYHDFSGSTATTDKLMMPVYFGPRLIFGSSSMPKWFVPFVEVGYGGLIKSNFGTSVSEFGHALVMGVGTEFYIHKRMYIGFDVRYFLGGERFLAVNIPTIGYRF